MKASQRQEGAFLRTVFKPEQHCPSGFVIVLPFVTKVKQSAIVITSDEQSKELEGVGALFDDTPLVRSTAQIAATKTKRMSEMFEYAMIEKMRENVCGVVCWGVMLR